MKKKLLLGVSSAVVGVLIFAVFLVSVNSVNSGSVSTAVVLNIDVYDKDGNLKMHYTKTGDLLLMNWVALQQYWFVYDADSSSNVYVVSQDGSNLDANYYQQSEIAGYRAKIVLGDNDTSPTIHDYRLGHQVAEFAVSSVTIASSGNDINLSITGSWTSDGNYTITEVGLNIVARQNDYSDKWITVFRDVLNTPIVLSTGDIISVTYTIMYDNP